MKINTRMVDRKLKHHLTMHDAWEAFLGNVDNDRFTRLSSPSMQLLHAFPFKRSAEGEEYWKNIYYSLCE
jgi:hypothetical protein